MKWKKKEKELTQEEAIALAKSELGSLWDWSLPLLCGIRQNGIARAYPLDPFYLEKSWISFSVDPMTFVGESVLHMMDTWIKRYSGFNFLGMGFLGGRYPFLRNKDDIERCLLSRDTKYPLALDMDGSLQEAFHLVEMPSFCLIHQGAAFFEGKGIASLTQVERAIHGFLRTNDPGLPLRPIYEGGGALRIDRKVMNFNASSSNGSQPPLRKVGHWDQAETHIFTTDPKAHIEFDIKTQTLGIVAESNATIAEKARILVEIDGVPVPDTLAGRDLEYDDEGTSYLEIRQGRLHEALNNLGTSRESHVLLRFPNAAKMPVFLHGLRMADSIEGFEALIP